MSNLVQNKCFPEINLPHFGLLALIFFNATINVLQVDAVECGTVNLYREAVLGGKEVMRDEWPFIAALYYSRTYKYFCGGSIISQKHVLTAAHCIQGKFKEVKISPDEITVRLGAYNLTDRNENGADDRNVTQVHVHPDWKFNEEKYDADIAILVLRENITFSNHIRPVCMPPDDFLIDGLNGTVVGWGKTENGTAEGIPRKIKVNALNDTYCYDTDMGIARYSSERSFCGAGSGTPNVGDSGGGFFAVAGSGWVQFGTVSFVRPEATGNILKVALYMKLPSLRNWITDTVEQSGGTISQATTKANLNCTYGFTSDRVYGCWLFDVNVRQENFVVEKFIGSHDFCKDNEDIEQIAFATGVMASIPHNIATTFKNLKFLIVYVDIKRIVRSNFQKLELLEKIKLSIAELDENSFWDLPNLSSFELTKNELKILPAATFSRNYKLTGMHIWSNRLKSLPRDLFRNNLLLDSVVFEDNLIETIDENIFETNAYLKEVSFRQNRLRYFSKNVFQNNPELQLIDLSYNLIKTVEDQTFKTNPKISWLNFDSNELEFLPAQLVGVDKIYLLSNRLEVIPANLFRNNSRLKIVHLANNSIETMDEHLFETNVLLREVYLELNRLTELPANLFKHNVMIEHVNFRNNELETVDERTFQWNTRLREIYFESNYLMFLPAKLFENNVLLETVRFDANYLARIDENTFQTNANLQEVSFKANFLRYLPENLFRNNPLLQIVDLSNNLFRTLNENIFSANTNLGKISIEQSALQWLPKNLFRSNSRLEYIDLGGSHLDDIETNFTELEHVNYINLSGNSCIDAVFYDVRNDTYTFSKETRTITNVLEFQDLVMANCSHDIKSVS